MRRDACCDLIKTFRWYLATVSDFLIEQGAISKLLAKNRKTIVHSFDILFFGLPAVPLQSRNEI